MIYLLNVVDCTKLPIPVYVLFALFAAFSLTEVLLAYFEKEMARKIVKPFCVLMLVIMAIVYRPNAWLIYTGALLGLAGDVLLIWKKNKKMLALGMFCFLLGHLAYIVETILIIAPAIGWPYYVAGGFLVVLFNLFFYGITKRVVKDGKMATASNLYLSSLGLVAIASLVACFLGYFSYMFLAFLGGLDFIASDSILAYTIYIRDVKRRDFFIMSLYLLGQGLIVIGLLLTVAAL